MNLKFYIFLIASLIAISFDQLVTANFLLFLAVLYDIGWHIVNKK